MTVQVETWNRGRGAAAVAVALTLTLATTASAAAEVGIEIDPPAPGEATPLRDPSEPTGRVEARSVPRMRFTARGRAWRATPVARLHRPGPLLAAVALSRHGWPKRSRSVVVAAGDRPAEALAAAGLAGSAGGPLLLTRRFRLPAHVVREVRRLRPRTAYVVGSVSRRVERRLRRLRVRTVPVGSGGAEAVAYAAARKAAELGANTSAVIVASTAALPHAVSAGAVASAKEHPVLLARPGTRAAVLSRRLRRLGVRRTLVVAGPSALPPAVLRGAPRVRRIHRVRPAASSTRLADYGRARGLNGRPVVVADEDLAAAAAAGVYAGRRRHAPLLVTGGAHLSPDLARWLSRRRLGVSAVVGSSRALGHVLRCQLRTARSRSWRCAEHELVRQGYNTGRIDGRVDHQSVWAVYAFEKVAGIGADGRFGEREWRAMVGRPTLRPRRPDLPANHIEIDIARQLILLVRGGRVAHAFHTSTGKPSTPTIRGTFAVYEKRDYRQPWNGIYKGIFWHRGYAIHGYPNVPLYPASHGCNRTYDGDQDFLWPKVSIGERVAVY